MRPDSRPPRAPPAGLDEPLPTPRQSQDRVSWRRLAPCIVLAAAVWLAAPGPAALRSGLALFALVAGLWTTQAVPLAATALLVPLLSTATGLQQPEAALAPFAHPIVFLFLGGFALAAALRRHGLGQSLAATAMRAARGRLGVSIVLLAGVTALLSLWMSNTAAAVVMLPLAVGLIDARRDAMGPREQAFVVLAVTYSTALGGMASIVSTPPNTLAAALSGAEFLEWFARVAPLSILLWLAMLGILYATLRPRLAAVVDIEPLHFRWTSGSRWTAVIFVFTVAGWAAGAPLGRLVGIEANMHAVVALAAIAALIITRAIAWRELEQDVQWSVLLLFGGGLALSEAMTASGSASFLVQQLLAVLQGVPRMLVLLAIVAFIVVLSELMSNTASAALALPLFMPLAPSIGLSPVAMAAAIALAASCGFMLPVATPPNALAFGTGRVDQASMMRCGWKLDAACILLITAAAHWAWT